jgi:hypothetical protein
VSPISMYMQQRANSAAAMVRDDVRCLRIAGLSATPGRDGRPLMRLFQSADAWISGCPAPARTKASLEVEGGASASTLLSGSDLRRVEGAFAVSGEVPRQLRAGKRRSSRKQPNQTAS